MKYLELLRKKNSILMLLKKNFFDLSVPSKISFKWNFGSILSLIVGVQLVSGVLLTLYYLPSWSKAFNLADSISRKNEGGWLIRLFHIFGGSGLFFFMYIHMGRGLYFRSFKFATLWFSGMLLYILFMLVAFLGYLLPWGQMSYWGATVMTNFITVMPLYGQFVVSWVWGGFSVGSPTMTRFFSLHFLFPLISVVLMASHFMMLHKSFSSNVLGANVSSKFSKFFPYFWLKDCLGFFFLGVFFFLKMFYCFSLLEYYKFQEVDIFVTPTHIQPEWYFLAPYAVLRSMPKKLGGVLLLLLFIIMILLLPLTNTINWGKFSIWVFVFSFLILTYLGSCPAENYFVLLSQVFSFIYFFMALKL